MPRPTLLLITLLITTLAGCVVHHHHYDDTAPTSTNSPTPDTAEAPDATEAPDTTETPSQPVDQSPAPEPRPSFDRPSNTTSEPPTYQPTYHSDGPLQGCHVRTFPSGWVEAHCDALHIFLMTGHAAQRNDEYLWGLTGEHAARRLGSDIRYAVDRGHTLTLEAGTFPMSRVDFSSPGPNSLTTTFGSSPAPDINADGLAIIAPTSHGRSALICFQQDRLDEERCIQYLDALTSRDLGPIGGSPDIVTVAGVPMRFDQACHFNQPESLVCILSSSLDWQLGPRADIESSLASTIDLYTDDHGIDGYYNPHETYPCTIGNNPAQCHEIAQQGVLDHPHRILYAALVHAPEGTYRLTCDAKVDAPLSQPCALIFGPVLTGRYH